MNTKTMKILTTIVTILLILSMGISVVYAAEEKKEDESGKTTTGTLTPPGKLEPTYKGTESITSIGQRIMGIVNTVGVVVAVVILMVLGIKYMMGSAEEKAEYKKTMMPYIIGAVLIFGATTIANAIYNFANGLK